MLKVGIKCLSTGMDWMKEPGASGFPLQARLDDYTHTEALSPLWRELANQPSGKP